MKTAATFQIYKVPQLSRSGAEREIQFRFDGAKLKANMVG